MTVYPVFSAGDVGSVYYGPKHPMKPHRICMTHHLVLGYDLHNKMQIYVSEMMGAVTTLPALPTPW